MGCKSKYRPLFLVCWLALALAGGGCDCARDKAPASDQVTASPAPFGQPQTRLPGWRGQPWVAGNELTTPTDVAIAADGTVYVAESWDTLSRIVERDGQWRAQNVIDDPETTFEEEKARLYSIDLDAKGDIWGLHFPSGTLWLIQKEKRSSFVLPELTTALESTLAADPHGGVLVGLNRPGPDGYMRSVLYDFAPDTSSLKELADFQDHIRAIVFPKDGAVPWVIVGRELVSVNSAGKTVRNVAPPLPADASFNGLAIAPDGSLFLATGDWKDKGAIFRWSKQAAADAWEPFYQTETGLQGINIGTSGDGASFLYGVSRRGGDLYRIPLQQPDAHTDYRLLRGNGISIAQNLAWAKNLSTGRAEILVNDGESGRLLRIDARDKSVRLLTETITYNHFGAKMSIDRNSDELLLWINTPGYESRFGLQRISPREPADVWPVLDKDAWTSFRPASAVVARNGATWITNLQERGEILELSADNQISLLVDAARVPLLRFPNGLAALDNGSLFVGVTQYNEHVYAGVPWSDTILMLTHERDIGWRCRTVFADKTHVDRAAINDFAVAPDGRVFIALRNKVYLAVPPYTNGVAEVLADGFGQALGLTLDGDGNLYVADGENGSIWRFTPPAS